MTERTKPMMMMMIMMIFRHLKPCLGQLYPKQAGVSARHAWFGVSIVKKDGLLWSLGEMGGVATPPSLKSRGLNADHITVFCIQWTNVKHK